MQADRGKDAKTAPPTEVSGAVVGSQLLPPLGRQQDDIAGRGGRRPVLLWTSIGEGASGQCLRLKTGTRWRLSRRLGKGPGRATRTLPPRLMQGQCPDAPPMLVPDFPSSGLAVQLCACSLQIQLICLRLTVTSTSLARGRVGPVAGSTCRVGSDAFRPGCCFVRSGWSPPP
jgi:hypothetical protein